MGTGWLWNAQYGVPYNALQLDAASGHGPYTWSVVDGNLPMGLTLSTDGVISGTTTATNGTTNFAVQVVDASGSKATRTLSLQVWGTPGLAISTTSIPGGMMGKSYATQLSSVGGGPLTWSLEFGSLPSGLTLNSDGSISGTPSTSGAFSFIVQVTDATGQHVNQLLQLKIAALPPGEILMIWNGKSIIVPSFDRDSTSYIPVWYVMELLQQTNVQNIWTGHYWYLQSTSQPNMSNLQTGTGTTSIYINGVLVQNLTPEVAVDPMSNQPTTYMPIPVAQLLSRLGLQTNWNGTTWTVTPLN